MVSLGGPPPADGSGMGICGCRDTRQCARGTVPSAHIRGAKEVRTPRARIFTALPARRRRWRHLPRATAHGVAARCWATCGNGPRTGSTRIRDSSAIRTRNTRNRGSATTKCCAADALPRARRSLRNTWRNFYTPDRRDVFAGFRTCAAVKHISSADNPQFKSLLALAQSSRERRQRGLSLLDGIHLVAAYREHIGAPQRDRHQQSGTRQRGNQALARGARAVRAAGRERRVVQPAVDSRDTYRRARRGRNAASARSTRAAWTPA